MATPETPLALVLSLYDYHSRLLPNALAGISDKDALNRLETKANHIAWIAGSLVYQRQWMATSIGLPVEPTLDEFFKVDNGQGFKGIAEDIRYPALADYLRDWDTVSSMLREGLAQMSDTQLHGPDLLIMPGGEYSFLETLTFCIDRESYCIGQLGLYRRLFGYEAMKWN